MTPRRRIRTPVNARPWSRSRRWERRIDEPRLGLTVYAYITRDEKPLFADRPYQWWIDDAATGHFEADGESKTLKAAKDAVATAWFEICERRNLRPWQVSR